MADVILVDENDRPLGKMEKMEAHRRGILHRAFSVFIFNSKGEMLLHKRAKGKYHNAGLWSNACCSHPSPGEDTLEAAKRRLKEEMGFATELKPLFEFTYKVEFSNGLTEHEFDHVFSGIYNEEIFPDHKEVERFCYKSPDAISEELQLDPEKYTAWFRLAFPKVITLKID